MLLPADLARRFHGSDVSLGELLAVVVVTKLSIVAQRARDVLRGPLSLRAIHVLHRCVCVCVCVCMCV